MNCFIIGTICTILISLLLIFTTTFVMVPIIYEKSTELQRKTIFPTSHLLPKNPEFDNFEKYGLEGVKNFYLVVNRINYVALGVWHLLPHRLVNSSIENPNFDFTASLAHTEYPIIIHFHSSGGNRIKFINMYSVLRIFFHVIAFDYRGYGDSSDVTSSEEAIVEDSMQLYKWCCIKHPTIAKLHEENLVPMGLFLEAPFTSMRDQIQQNSFHKLFSWLPWYESTMLDPLEKNGLVFNTTKYITMVDCPIMIIHAKDDRVTPYTFGEKVFQVAKESQDLKKGNATFHLLPENLNCGHFSIRKAPQLINYIRNHIITCQFYNKMRD